MDWHIITSSKGGSGKTLISLMLLTYHRNRDEKVLVIDLNGMNGDLRRLVAEASHYHQENFNENFLELDLGKRDIFYVENLPGRYHSYMVGWLRKAFKIFSPISFSELLAGINQACQVGGQIRQQFGTINTIIIDTSYHFCNLFPERQANYDEDKPLASLKGENIFIWFLWVYRQLHNLITAGSNPTNPFDIDAITVKDRASKIETNMALGNLTNNQLEGSPFVHVFSPVFFRAN